MKIKSVAVGILALVIIVTIFISGCVEEKVPPEEKLDCPYECCIDEIYNAKECAADYECKENVCVKKSVEQIPESVLRELCEKESWPPEGCDVISDPEGKRLCEKCEELLGYVKKDEGEPKNGKPEEDIELDSQFSFVEGDSESWLVLQSMMGAYVPSPSWFRFDYLSEGPSMRCRQFANLEKAKNNVESLGEAVIDYVGIASEPYLFEFGEQGVDFVNIVAGILNTPPNDYVIYKCEAEEVQEGGHPIPKEDIGAEAIINSGDMIQITSYEGEGNSADPDWSPDGTQIVFGRQTETGEDKSGNLYIINSDGTGLTKIGHENLFDASWSAVDNKILCTGGKYSDLYMIDLDVDKTKVVPFDIQYTIFPAWSPDGKKIVYSVYDDSGAPLPLIDRKSDGTGILSSIWIMNSDGTGKTQLTTNEDGYCADASFSPDGSKIVYNKGFMSPSGGQEIWKQANEIWVMNSDGSNKQAIYKPEASVHFLHQHAWSKNNEIIFERIWWKRTPQIWIMNSDGTNRRCLVKVPELSKPEDCADSWVYGDIAWDNTGTKIVTAKAKNPFVDRPEVWWDANLITFSLKNEQKNLS